MVLANFIIRNNNIFRNRKLVLNGTENNVSQCITLWMVLFTVIFVVSCHWFVAPNAKTFERVNT